jgi:hypothetical protein
MSNSGIIISITCLLSLFCMGCSSMKINPQQDLLPGETILYEKAVVAKVNINRDCLMPYASGQLWWLLAMSGQASMEGEVYLTNYRLIFKSNDVSNLMGKFSIFLPTIDRIDDSSSAINSAISIYTGDSVKYDFITWGGVSKFIDLVKENKKAITPARLDYIKKLTISNMVVVGDGLKVERAGDKFGQVILLGNALMDVPESCRNEISAANIINLLLLVKQ